MSKIQVDSIVNKDDTGGVDFPKGVTVTGVVTATSFAGNVTGNVTGDITIGAGSTSAPSLAPSGDSNTGVFFPAADTIAFAEGGSEAARIDSSGRLLVGTSTARTNAPGGTEGFLVEGTSSTNSQNRFIQQVFGSSGTDGPYLGLAKTRSTSIGGNTVVQSGDELGGIYFQGADGSNFKQGASILSYVDGTPGSNDMPGRLVFSTTADGASSPTERMRISDDGQIDITGPGYTPKSNSVYFQQTSGGDFYIINRGNNFVRIGTNDTQRFIIANDGYLYAQTTATGNTNLTLRNNSSSADATDFFQARDNANNLELVIKPDGDVENANNSYTGFSDVKLKENIVDASSQWEDIKALRVRNYNYKESTGYSTHKQIGVIAQELELVSPGLVKESIDTGDGPDGEHEVDLGTTTKSVNYSVLYMKAVKALQEAQTRIETLESQNAAILARIDALEAG